MPIESAFQRFTRIIKGWVGKSVDYDKAYGAQCVDFARQYAKDSGYPIGTFSWSAYNGWKTWSPFNNTWIRVTRDGSNFPIPGDIVFFAPTPKNLYGHVAIAHNNCNAKTLIIIEQNAGSGNWDGKGSNAIKITTTSYNGNRGVCVGWFTRRV